MHDRPDNTVAAFWQRSITMKTILLVDDEIENLKSLSEVLSRFGYRVIAKPDGREALAALQEGAAVDLVITDYRMPNMDGLEFLTQLRRVAPSVPTIMLTAYGVVETYLKSLSLGVFEYINKPVKAKELGMIVKAALDSSAQSRQQSAASSGAGEVQEA